jgi:hypothetical protein
MSIVRLSKEHISEYWHIIGPAIVISLPPTVAGGEEHLNNLLLICLDGRLEVWAIMDGEDMIGVTTTEIVVDDATRSRSLLIYTLHSFSLMPEEIWDEGLKFFGSYAKKEGCSEIIAYSKIERVIEKAKAVGADTSYHVLTFTI